MILRWRFCTLGKQEIKYRGLEFGRGPWGTQRLRITGVDGLTGRNKKLLHLTRKGKDKSARGDTMESGKFVEMDEHRVGKEREQCCGCSQFIFKS